MVDELTLLNRKTTVTRDDSGDEKPKKVIDSELLRRQKGRKKKKTEEEPEPEEEEAPMDEDEINEVEADYENMKRERVIKLGSFSEYSIQVAGRTG